MSRRRIPGRGAGGAGAAGTSAGARGALLLGVAVILGIVLLQQFDGDIDTGGSVAATSIPDEDTTSTTRRVGLTTVPAAITTTTARARPKAEVRVLVANGAGVRGLGANTTNALKSVGYTTLTPTDATATVPRTSIQFAEGWEAEAREVAGVLTLPATVVTRLASPPVPPTDIGDAKVIVILGEDVTTAATTTTTTTSTTVAGAAATTSTTRRP